MMGFNRLTSPDDAAATSAGVDQSVENLSETSDLARLARLHLNFGATSLSKLICEAVQCLNDAKDDGDDEEDSEEDVTQLPFALLLVHQWYVDSDQFVRLLKQLLEQKTVSASDACAFIRYWLLHFPEHFDCNSKLYYAVEEFRQTILDMGQKELADSIDFTSMPSCSWMRNVSEKRSVTRNISLSFDQWTPEDIAVSLTHIEFKMLRRITFADYCEYAIRTQLNRVPTLQRSIAVFNSISRWVQCMVLSKTTANERAQIIMKFIRVAKCLRQLNNFNTLMAVVGGLTHSALARLRKTSLCISQESRTTLTEYSNILSSDCNFSAYRKALNSCHSYRIPIIGVHLKDLIALHSATPDYVGEDLINCRKLAQLVLIFKHLILDLDRPQQLPDLNDDLIHTLKVALSMPYSDDEIYALSLCREPRSLLRPTVRYAGITADWAEGVCSRLEPLVLQKHVHAMVEAVFKHYDLDKDGYISQEEFELFAGNFPLIESFANFDTDQDGKISKQELKQYFLRIRRNYRTEMRHNFRETTFLAPTFCYNCKKLLWGILRQGLKCHDCGVAVHRSCKEKSSCCIRRRSSERVRCKSFSPSESPEEEQKLNPRYNSFKHHLLNFTWNRARSRHSSKANPPSPEFASPPVNHRFLAVAESKQRSWSESCHYYRNNSPLYDQGVSLASEEVFDVDDTS